jgi:hypothetical protein
LKSILNQADFLFDKRESSSIAWLDLEFETSRTAVTTDVNSGNERTTGVPDNALASLTIWLGDFAVHHRFVNVIDHKHHGKSCEKNFEPLISERKVSIRIVLRLSSFRREEMG